MGIWHRWHWRRGFPIRKIWTFSLVGKLAMPIPKHVSTSFSTTNPKSWPSVRCGAVSYVGLSILHTHILHTQTQLTVNQTNCIFFIQSTFYFYLVISRIHISTRHLSVPCQMAGRGQKHVAPWPYAFRNPLPVRHKRIFEFSGHPSTKGKEPRIIHFKTLLRLACERRWLIAHLWAHPEQFNWRCVVIWCTTWFLRATPSAYHD